MPAGRGHLYKVDGCALLFGCVTAFLSLTFGEVDVSGKPFREGVISATGCRHSSQGISIAHGSIIVILTFLVLAIILSTQFSFVTALRLDVQTVRDRGAHGFGVVRAWRQAQRRHKLRAEVVARQARRATLPAKESKVGVTAEEESTPAVRDTVLERERPEVTAPPEPRMPLLGKRTKVATVDRSLPLLASEPFPKAPAERRLGSYTLPPLALLDAPRTERKIDERELMDGARLLEEKCREFAVEGSVVQIHPGPVVTTFEFKPDAGVKYAKITSLADDLCPPCRPNPC